MNTDGFALFGLVGVLLWVGMTVLVLLVSYWIVRLAVRHALRDHAERRGAGTGRDR